MSVGKFSEARDVYKCIANLNSKPMFSNEIEGEVKQTAKVDHSLIKLIKMKSLRKPLIIIPFIWFTVDIVYYGIVFSLGQL